MLNFDEIKSQHKIEDVAKQLGITLEQKGDKYRATCPVCKKERSLVITPDKGFFCFGTCNKGGDVLTLVSKIKGIPVKDAAKFLSGEEKPAFDVAKYQSTLQPDHPALQELEISKETIIEWRGGYCSTGVNRGRLALPITLNGHVTGYIGLRIKGEGEDIAIPKGVNVNVYVFGEDHLQEGQAQLVRHPLAVLRAFEMGMNAVCFLTEDITADQLDQLADVLRKKNVESLEIF
jgi:hypothetical protein